jgi:Flp pilus assembly protein TadG
LNLLQREIEMKVKASKSRFKGLALVETAIVFPLLLLLTLGVIQYSWLFLKAQQITNAARCGARVGIVGGDITGTVDTLMIAAGMSKIKSGYTVSSVLGSDSGDPVTVTVTVPDAKKVALINAKNFLPLPASLHASVTMAKEGP